MVLVGLYRQNDNDVGGDNGKGFNVAKRFLWTIMSMMLFFLKNGTTLKIIDFFLRKYSAEKSH